MSWALIYTKKFKASDYRDKIYPVMNFVDPANLRLQFDYHLSVEEVYITSATQLIETRDYPILLHSILLASDFEIARQHFHLGCQISAPAHLAYMSRVAL